MSAEPRGSVALVTGGTGSLGRAVVHRFVRLGYRVHVPWLVGSEAELLRSALDEHASSVRLREADVSSEQQVGQLFDEIRKEDGDVQVLANLVGGFEYGSLASTEVSAFERMYQLNVSTVFLCCRAAAPSMVEGGWGRIVNVAAVPAITGAGANMTAYSASKAAVLNFTTSLAAELTGTGVTVNAIAPSIIDTEANRRAMPDADRSKWISPAAIAEVVEFLTGEAARIVTGNAVRLSAG